MIRENSGANLPVLRHHNTALVMTLLRSATVGDGAGVSRPELAGRTGLTPQAVSKIVSRLRAEGLVDEAGRGTSTGGKPRTLLRLVRGTRFAVGAHLDRDELTVVLTDLVGAPVTVRSTPLDFGRPAGEVLDSVAREVRAAIGPAPAGSVLGVGVACPGPLDHVGGVLHRVTGFPAWDGYPLRDRLSERLGVPVVLDKDTNAAALTVGGGGSFAYLHLGTGLGAGLVLGGRLHRGDRTGAGEFGHQVVQLDGPSCGCGNRGCLEALCLAAVGRGDLMRAARLLGIGAANLVSLLDIDRVVLGGRTVLAAGELFAGRVAAVLEERSGGRSVPVSVAPGGSRTVAEGAALLAAVPVFGPTVPG